MSYTILVGDPRYVGSGNPPVDMNNANDVLSGNSPIVYNVLNTAYADGADRSGATDSYAAIQAAIDALPASGGVIYFPAGTYKVTTTLNITKPGVYLIGDGSWSTVINYTGSGDCIRMYSTQQYTSGFGGGMRGLMIDGTSASAGACGIHVGDIYQLTWWDAGVRKFQGSGSKGWWFDNNYYWTEDMYGHIFAQQNTSNVVFDNSANTGGSATNSFARTLLDIVLDMKGVGDGVTLQNGALVYDSKLGIYGNCDYGTSQFHVLSLPATSGLSFTATHASPCVFTASGSYYSNGTFVTLAGGSLPGGFSAQGYYVVAASGTTFELSATSGGSAINSSSTGSGTVTGPYSTIQASRLDIGVECNATSGTQPITINFGTAAKNFIRNCTGIIDFTAANAFANAVNWNGSFQFDGIVLGDTDLLRVTSASQVAYANGAISNSAFITTRYNGLATAAPAGNVTGVVLGTNDPGFSGQAGGAVWANQTFTLVNTGAGSITFAASGTSHVSTGTSCVIAAGQAMTFIWIAANSLWYPVT